MPCVENWKSNPLHVIENIYENRKEGRNWKDDVAKYFSDKFSKLPILKSIPSLNDDPLHELHSGCLVRFRCMIQDTYEPEYFLETYEVVNKTSKKQWVQTSRYRDIVHCPENCEVVIDSPKSETGCRQVVYCVTIPEETQWVKEKFRTVNSQPSSSTASSGQKRSLEDEGIEESMEADSSDAGSQASSKRIRQSNNNLGSKRSKEPLKKNHPLPGEDGPVCIVKIYDESVELKVNEMYEFVGVLSADPELSATFDATMDENKAVNGNSISQQAMEEQKAHSPPASLVPRLHCVEMFKLQHNNPLLPFNQPVKSVQEDFCQNAATIRNELLQFFKQVTFGDEFAAEYLLSHLVSRVYTRTGVLAVGKMSLNISKIAPNSKYPKLLAELLGNLLTKAHFLPMTLENMNKLPFIPTKNYATNRLDTGLLQLPTGLELTIDESALQPGQLDQNGVKNIQALATLLNLQKVDYNFQFHPVIFHHDTSVLVLSEGKSILPCDCQIPLNPELTVPSDLESYFNKLSLPTHLIEKFRSYLTVARLGDYELDQDIMKTIENDFVSARQENADNMTADDLHAHLVLARSMCISMGENKLSLELWNRVRRLEEERKARLRS